MRPVQTTFNISLSSTFSYAKLLRHEESVASHMPFVICDVGRERLDRSRGGLGWRCGAGWPVYKLRWNCYGRLRWRLRWEGVLFFFVWVVRVRFRCFLVLVRFKSITLVVYVVRESCSRCFCFVSSISYARFVLFSNKKLKTLAALKNSTSNVDFP